MFGTLSGLNPWVQLLCSTLLIASMVWGAIWGGIRLWHRRASRTLESKFKPYFDKIDFRLDQQDDVMDNVQHEVTTNSGQSLKDGVKAVGNQVSEIMDVLTTKPPTLLDPYPRLGVIDTQKAQGYALKEIKDVVEKLAEDILLDSGMSSRDKLDQISREQGRVAAEKRIEARDRS